MSDATWEAVLPADLDPLQPGNLIAVELDSSGGLEMRHNCGIRLAGCSVRQSSSING